MILKGFKLERGEEMVTEHLRALNKVKATDTSNSHHVRKELKDRIVTPLLAVGELMKRNSF